MASLGWCSALENFKTMALKLCDRLACLGVIFDEWAFSF